MTQLPDGFGNYEIRVVGLVVAPKGEPVFSEQSTRVLLTDEAAGEFIAIEQQGGSTDISKVIAVNGGDEWKSLKAAVDFMEGQCR